MITEQSNPTTDITKKINPLGDSEEEIEYETADSS